MQEINTENIYKYLQPEKSGEFKKSLLFAKNRVDLRNPCFLLKIGPDLRNPCFLPKIRQINRIPALTKNQADLQNPCAYRKSGGQ
jgi:hypothetical protein